jgi:hypothetical protein
LRKINLILLILFAAAALGGSFTCTNDQRSSTISVIAP